MNLMKIFNLIRVLTFLLFVLISNNVIKAQVVVERSKDKVTISGSAYYVHQVKKGETAY